ncbi:hypothetical protein [Adhaeribacter aquaticus]|uniref:hypothetical protein n=1 Tax=Adhaeribacter aquaticus TaxID=299567 RepID=UPI00047CAF53|nr:hypothetical protein [Adhaeribacter aquaticus]
MILNKLLLPLLCLLISFPIQAKDLPDMIEQQAQVLTTHMATDLNLDSLTYKYLQNLNREKLIKLHELQKMQEATEELKLKIVEQLTLEMDNRFKKMLQPDQVNLYENKKKELPFYSTLINFK